MSEPSETETVGYKRPPAKSQFKPGTSGNPRGRPKRKVDMSAALNKAFNDKIVVTGLGKTLTGMEAFVQSIVDRALQGDSKAIPGLLRLFAKAKLFHPVPDPTRLTGVVVMPAAYNRDEALGIEQGWYEVHDGLGFWVDPKTKQIYV
jgi:Family of unknown function (DUF5681)